MCVIERDRFFSTRMELLGRRLREAKRRGEALFINYTGSHTEKANNLLPADEAGHLALPDVVESDNPDPVSWVLVLAVLDLGENLISGLASEHGELPHGPVPVLVESRAGEEELVGVGLLLAGELDAWSPSVADEVVDLPGDLLVGERGEVGKALVPLLRLEDLFVVWRWESGGLVFSSQEREKKGGGGGSNRGRSTRRARFAGFAGHEATRIHTTPHTRPSLSLSHTSLCSSTRHTQTNKHDDVPACRPWRLACGWPWRRPCGTG